MSDQAVARVVRAGDTTKADPFTIVIVANPALEAPFQSGTFIGDPMVSDSAAFEASVRLIDQVLFGELPGQREGFLGDPTIGPAIRVVSLVVAGLAPEDGNALVGQDRLSDLLIARRDAFVLFLARYDLRADVAYAVSRSASHDRATAWFTSDDDTRPGVAFTLDGMAYTHRYYSRVPGTVAIHATSRSLTALHEFGHALSSYENGKVVDLYVDSSPGVNNKHGRPVPVSFADYNGMKLAADASRDHLGYPPTWQSYHCDLVDAGFPAIMDDYWQAPDGAPEHCAHDRITRQFLLDRVRAKMAR